MLLQSLAGLWPFASGTVRFPAGRTEAMFVPQLPYIPLGDLRTVASYPLENGSIGDREIQAALIKVALSQLAIRLNDVGDWAKTLSVGEQQRIAFARILLNRPSVVFLDESTSAMDEGLELMLYELLRTELPESIVVSVSHRATVEQFHTRRLELAGEESGVSNDSPPGVETTGTPVAGRRGTLPQWKRECSPRRWTGDMSS